MFKDLLVGQHSFRYILKLAYICVILIFAKVKSKYYFKVNTNNMITLIRFANKIFLKLTF